MTRKNFLTSSLLTAAGVSLKATGFAKTNSFSAQTSVKIRNDAEMKICIFSKQLQWMNYQDMASAG